MNYKRTFIFIGFLAIVAIIVSFVCKEEKVPNNTNKEIEKGFSVSMGDNVNETEEIDNEIENTKTTEESLEIMPNVKGENINDIATLFSKKDIITEFNYTEDPEILDGVIVSQDVEEGESLEGVNKITMTVNMNPEKKVHDDHPIVAIPYVVGKTIDEAIMLLGDNGLSYTINKSTKIDQYEGTYDIGTVVDYCIDGENAEETPEDELPGSAEAGSTIVLFVNMGTDSFENEGY